MDVDERLELITRNSLEVVTVEELRSLLETKTKPSAYIGFEPSGFIHIGQMTNAFKVVDMQRAGIDVTVFLADWHAMINDKLGGDIESIRACGKYIRDCFLALGVDKSTEFVYASDLINEAEYWERFIRICKASSLMRVKRAMTIMGRSEEDVDLDASKVMYPPMQVADIFHLDVDIAYSGMDQRRAHMLARDTAEKLGWKKPIALHTPLLMSLQGGVRMDPVDAKMSKSSPDTAVFMHDSPDEVRRKLKNAFCPPEVDGNPVLETMRLIVFPKTDVIRIDRSAKHGGPVDYTSFSELKEAYESRSLHPMDLKNGTAEYVNRLLEPVREYFSANPDNLEKVKALSITR
ncbi:MAG: tyrosine--tRNA ligase [Methanobacteriota archaeon]|nr:MAG: tyrosine--tRNA ligase [Euryarchaeota archaeon]